jgi:hypothetical protein
MPLRADDPMLLKAIEVFESQGYTYLLKLSGSMMWVENSLGERYAFYPTTGRWAPYGVKDKHYRSKGPEDFLERFVKPREIAKSKEAECTYGTLRQMDC